MLGETSLSIGQKDYIETLKKSANLLLDIVNDILDFSKIEAGKVELEKSSFNLYELIIATLKLFKPQTLKKQIKLDFEIMPDVEIGLSGDAGRLRQVLLNLVGNAIKFTEEGEVFSKYRRKRMVLSDLKFPIRDRNSGI